MQDRTYKICDTSPSQIRISIVIVYMYVVLNLLSTDSVLDSVYTVKSGLSD